MNGKLAQNDAALMRSPATTANTVDIKSVCGTKVNGLLEMVHNGRPALVPVCDKHLEQLQAAPRD